MICFADSRKIGLGWTETPKISGISVQPKAKFIFNKMSIIMHDKVRVNYY